MLIGLHSADNMNLKIFYGIRYGFPTFLILVSYSILGSYVVMKRRSIKKLRYFVEKIDISNLFLQDSTSISFVPISILIAAMYLCIRSLETPENS